MATMNNLFSNKMIVDISIWFTLTTILLGYIKLSNLEQTGFLTLVKNLPKYIA